ncbi:MAG: hypothetical protein WCD46_03265 [Desulfobacterales bacterium]
MQPLGLGLGRFGSGSFPGFPSYPKPDLRKMTSVDERKIYSGKLMGAILLFIGVVALGCGTAISFVAADPLPAFALMGLPASSLGLIALLAGVATLAARIEISRGCLSVAAPQWRGCPMPPVKKISLRWDAIKAVRHRTEIYHLLPGKGLAFPVEAYAIDSENESVIFAGKSVPHLAQALSDIALRSGRPIQEEAPVQASILGSLLKGPPRWR